MVSKDEIISVAKKEKMPIGTIEKDFVLTYILKRIYESDLKDKLAFKGGTALHKLYLQKRMSIDLDFTEIKPVDINELRTIIENKDINSKIKELISAHDSIKIILSYMSALDYKNNIVIDISKREKPTLGLIIKKLKTPFFKEIDILTFQLEELIAEKIRAIIQRNKPRDYLDIFYILNKNNFDLNKSIEIAKQKLKESNDTFDVKRIFDDLDTIESLWEQDLMGLLPNAPSFSTVIKKIKTNFPAV